MEIFRHFSTVLTPNSCDQVRYLGRTKEQVLADAGHTHQGGSSGYEEFG